LTWKSATFESEIEGMNASSTPFAFIAALRLAMSV
jgi:hypothetical protein